MPSPLVFTRFALGTAFLLTLLAVRRRLEIPPRESWPALAAMGFLGIFLHQMLQAHGLRLIVLAGVFLVFGARSPVSAFNRRKWQVET